MLVLHINAPAPARFASKAGYVMRVVNREARQSSEVSDQRTRERSVVAVGAGDDARGGNLLIGGAALHHQRDPVVQLVFVFGILHPVIAMMRAHRREALFEKRDVLGPVHEAHMRDRMDERLRVLDRAFFHQIGPELTRQVELHVDLERLRDIDRSIRPFRRVVELAIRCVAGAGIVPGVRTLERRAVERFDHLNGERGLELFEKHAKRGAHDARANENDVRVGGSLIRGHGWLR